MAETETPQTQPAAAEPPSMLEDIIKSIYTPGVNSGLLSFLLLVFVALFVVLGSMAILMEFNIHVLVMLLLATGLAVSLVWFLKELQAVNRSEAAAEASPDQKPATETRPVDSAKADKVD
eukprot:m.221747 g.221747  ORF g.221747 m.221747 type:complete len:120 (+) comp10645_c0_seq1:99-458(+)